MNNTPSGLSHAQLLSIASQHGAPLYVYSRENLLSRAQAVRGLKLPFGHTVRFAMKSNPHKEVLALFDEQGLHFDASSGYEAKQLLDLGVDGAKISLSSQQPAHNLKEITEAGVLYVATSLHQLELFAGAAPQGASLALRVNPGFGSGFSNRTTTGGLNSSFGIWHEYLPDALELAAKRGLIVDRLQVHIGAGADTKIWGQLIDTALKLAETMPDVTVLDIGGGYKVHRFEPEQETDMDAVAAVFSDRLEHFGKNTGRKLHLEIEPGTWLVAHAGVLLAEVVDMVDTGEEGYKFLRLNTGMNDILRPSLYGARHKISVLNDATVQESYIVVGHNCETGDILTPAAGDPEGLEPRILNKATIGDIVAIHDTGAYCATFSTKGYNAFPSAEEIMV